MDDAATGLPAGPAPTGPDPAGPDPAQPDPALGRALLESRQRWRDLVALAADFAFETDAAGRLGCVLPDPALGWPAAALLDQPAERLLADPAGGFDPFHPTAPLRGRHAWLRRADGTVACLLFSTAPLLGPTGRIVGARGLGIDVTEQNQAIGQAAAALRRSAMVEHILERMHREVLAPRMMQAVLEAVRDALGAEGAAVAAAEETTFLHETGAGAADLLAPIVALIAEAGRAGAPAARIEAGRPLLAAACRTRFGARAGLAVWRPAGARAWDAEERQLAAAAGSIVRMVLEHRSIQREMARQARTDALTGLLNRRAFLEELPRHIERLDREALPGTMVFIDLDNFKPANDHFGHELGDQVLCRTAALLRRTVRPTDLVARLGGDEFALWLNGADHLTAAERAEQLRIAAPGALAEAIGAPRPRLSLSMGIATRAAGSGEDIDSLMCRADVAMFEVKRQGRGHWRVAPDPEA